MTAADDDATILCSTLEALLPEELLLRLSVVASRYSIPGELPFHASSLSSNASEGRRLSQVGLVSSVSLCTWNELVRL